MTTSRIHSHTNAHERRRRCGGNIILRKINGRRMIVLERNEWKRQITKYTHTHINSWRIKRKKEWFKNFNIVAVTRTILIFAQEFFKICSHVTNGRFTCNRTFITLLIVDQVSWPTESYSSFSALYKWNVRILLYSRQIGIVCRGQGMRDRQFRAGWKPAGRHLIWLYGIHINDHKRGRNEIYQ